MTDQATEIARLERVNGELRALLRKHVDPYDILPERRTPAQAAEVALEEVERAGRVTRFLSELATMTDIEADFMTGYEVRERCRLLADDRFATVPRFYGEEDRARAMAALWQENRIIGAHQAGKFVDAVAEALGMRRAGA